MSATPQPFGTQAATPQAPAQRPAPARLTMSLAPNTVPRWPLALIAVILAGTLLSVATLRLSGTEVRTPDAATVASRALRFEDRPDGSIAVIDAASGREIQNVQGEAGFVRGTLRALARERHMRGVGPQPPFELLARADGRLTLHDPATGQRVDLEAFGPTHSQAFAQWLVAGSDGAAATASR